MSPKEVVRTATTAIENLGGNRGKTVNKDHRREFKAAHLWGT